MKKSQELAPGAKGCFAKAGNDEMLFILRAQDATAGRTVVNWIAMNFDTAPEKKLREAFECALEMRKGFKKPAD